MVGMGWDFLVQPTCKGLAKDRSILVDIVDIRAEKIVARAGIHVVAK